MTYTEEKGESYEFQGMRFVIPPENTRLIEDKDRDKYDAALGFLNKQGELQKVEDSLVTLYLQLGEPVIVTDSSNRDWSISFTDKLTQRIRQGLLNILEDESEI